MIGITSFRTIQNDSGKPPQAAWWRSDRIRTRAGRNRLKQSQCFASVLAPSRQSSGRGFEPRWSRGTLQLSTRCSSLALPPSRSLRCGATRPGCCRPRAMAPVPTPSRVSPSNPHPASLPLLLHIGCGEARSLLAVRFYKLRQSRWFDLRFALLTMRRRGFDRFCPKFPDLLSRDACLVSIHKKTNRGSC